MQNLINKHTVDLENVQSYKKKEKGKVARDVKLAQNRCQNLFMSKIDHL
jgi:hypothetical protein